MSEPPRRDDSPTDEELVARIRETPTDDLRDFDMLVHRHRSHVVANCRYLTREREQAEDLAQEVFVKAYFGLARFRGGSSFRTWLQRIKINHCLDHLKARRGRVFVDVDEPAVANAAELTVGATAELDLMQSEDRARLTTTLEAMPEGLRMPLVLRDLDGLPYAEIADLLGISLSAVKMRILRGRQELKRRLQGTR